MTDTMTKKPLRVTTDNPVWPFIELPLSQVDEVRRLLDSHGVSYSVDENAISWNGGPYTTTISLGRGGNAGAVQAILDNAVE
jgi:hypothetical protein